KFSLRAKKRNKCTWTYNPLRKTGGDVLHSTGNMITVDAWPDFNVKTGPATINIAITVHSGEVWLVGDMVGSTPCQTPLGPATGFDVAGGQFSFTMPIKRPQKFSLCGLSLTS